ncbi:MAG: DUF433 domain-containing protein [Rubrobacteraceae bacterium]
MWRTALHSWNAYPGDGVLDLLANGFSTEQILEEMPDLEAEDIYSSLRFAIRHLDHSL